MAVKWCIQTHWCHKHYLAFLSFRSIWEIYIRQVTTTTKHQGNLIVFYCFCDIYLIYIKTLNCRTRTFNKCWWLPLHTMFFCYLGTILVWHIQRNKILDTKYTMKKSFCVCSLLLIFGLYTRDCITFHWHLHPTDLNICHGKPTNHFIIKTFCVRKQNKNVFHRKLIKIPQISHHIGLISLL